MMSLLVIYISVMTGSECGGKISDRRHQSQSPTTCNNISGETSSSRWHLADSPEKPKGIAVVLHGLNLRPAKMASIISVLNEAQIDALKVSLYGHGQNYPHAREFDDRDSRMEALKTVSYQIWMEETYQAYCRARKRSDQLQVPLFFVGYSLGGLLGADLFTSRVDVRFERMVLFAPALDLRAILYAGRIFSLFPRLVLPSLASNSYRQNGGLPIAAYNALLKAQRHFKKNLDIKLNIPTLIYIDRHDELVSYAGLKRIAKRHRLDNWSFHILQKGRIGVKVKIHHLIIDKHSLGSDVWQEIKQIMIRHLLS